MCVKPISVQSPSDDPRYPNDFVQVPCGYCVECRKKRRLEWVTRMVHERDEHPCGVFVTLTYNDLFLPHKVFSVKHLNGHLFLECRKKIRHVPEYYKHFYNHSIDSFLVPTLVKSDYQKFIKRVRKRLTSQKRLIRYFGCGEYGSNTYRPHYHIIIYGMDIMDEKDREIIVKSWELGSVHLGTVTPRSIAYTAGYITKKLKKKEYSYSGIEPSFQTCSQGIGRDWCDSNVSKIVSEGKINMNDYTTSVPRYYRKRIEKIDEDMYYELLNKTYEYEEKQMSIDGFPHYPNIQYLYYQGSSEEQMLYEKEKSRQRNQIFVDLTAKEELQSLRKKL